MSDMPTTPTGEPSTAVAAGGFLQNLIDIYAAPREAFVRICRWPTFILPALLLIVVSAASTGIWLHKVDAQEFTRQQMEQFGGKFAENLTPEQRTESLEMQAKMLGIKGWLGVFLGTPFVLLLAGGTYWMIFRFFYASEVRFSQALAITSWTFLAVDTVSWALRLLVFWLKGVWEIDPRLVLQASPGAFVAASAPKWLWALASMPDLLTIWTIVLLAIGFGEASRRSAASAAWGIAVPWICIGLLGVGFMAIFM